MEIGIDNEICYDLHLSQSKGINESIVVISRHLSNKQIVDKEYHQQLAKNIVIGFLKTKLDSGRIDKQTFCGHVNTLATYYHPDSVLSDCGDYQDINGCLYQQTIDRVLRRAVHLFDNPALR